MEGKSQKKMKTLCLHGFRTSGKFLQKQLSKWDPSLFHCLELDFLDGMFQAGGKSDIEDIFPPPYFEWFQFNEDFSHYTNLEKCISYLCDYISRNGPFDGFLGFSQGATLSRLLIGYQAKGRILKDHPPISFFISISGGMFKPPSIREIAYKEPVKIKSVHFIGAKDWMRLQSEELATTFVSPTIIRHPQGHTVPSLDEEAVKKLQTWCASLTKGRCLADEENIEAGQKETNREKLVKTGKMEVETSRKRLFTLSLL